METKKVQWHSAKGHWLIGELHQDLDKDGVLLAQWADKLPDLTPVRLVLAAVNYSTHWLSMPGVSGRNLARALPFALEESLIEDIDHYVIVPAGKVQKRVRAYAVARDLIERLVQECELHHLQVRELLAETQLLPEQNLMRYMANGWQISLPGRFEGWVSQAALTPLLEHALHDYQSEELTVWAPGLDRAQLLKTSLDTGFGDVFERIEVTATDGRDACVANLHNKPVNLLVGEFQQREIKENKPAPWWQALAALAAVWLVMVVLHLLLENQALEQKQQEVRQASIALYKQLFPGERVRANILDKQFRDKLKGGGRDTNVGFLSLMNATAKVYAAKGLQQSVRLQSVRFNDRLNELLLEVKAGSLAELQTLKQALEQEGLNAEVASATNDKDGVRGRLKVGGAV